jgi:hypothetical protein
MQLVIVRLDSETRLLLMSESNIRYIEKMIDLFNFLITVKKSLIF